MAMNPKPIRMLAAVITIATAVAACSERNASEHSSVTQSSKPNFSQVTVAPSTLLTAADASKVLLQYWKQQGTMVAGQDVEFGISVTNKTSGELTGVGANPVYVTYDWLAAGGAPVKWDNPHTVLPAAIPVGGAGAVTFKVKAPDVSGDYILEVAVGQEGGLALREHGQQPLRYGIKVMHK
jgi:hypothetical protein